MRDMKERIKELRAELAELVEDGEMTSPEANKELKAKAEEWAVQESWSAAEVAADNSMRKAGRDVWNEDDRDILGAEFLRVWRLNLPEVDKL